MLQSNSKISSQINPSSNKNEVNKGMSLLSASNDPLLINFIDKITNSTQKINHIMHVPPEEKSEAIHHSGLLKFVLFGTLILAGGALTAGCRYLMGRAETDCLASAPQVTHLALSAVLNTVETGEDQKAETDSSVTPGKFTLPYSYYEGIYGDTAKRNELLESMTTVPISKYKHDNMREIYYNTLPKDMFFPLGEKLYNELAYFCSSHLQLIVFKAYKADPESRCRLLAKLIDKIDEYKFYDTLLRDENYYKESLTADEHAEEIITRRKLMSAYLAAESIIERKELGVFYITAMADDKNYSAEELAERDERIRNYIPIHYLMGECIHPGQINTA